MPKYWVVCGQLVTNPCIYFIDRILYFMILLTNTDSPFAHGWSLGWKDTHPQIWVRLAHVMTRCKVEYATWKWWWTNSHMTHIRFWGSPPSIPEWAMAIIVQTLQMNSFFCLFCKLCSSDVLLKNFGPCAMMAAKPSRNGHLSKFVNVSHKVGPKKTCISLGWNNSTYRVEITLHTVDGQIIQTLDNFIPRAPQISKLFSSSKGWDGWTKQIKPHSMT